MEIGDGANRDYKFQAPQDSLTKTSKFANFL